MTEHVIYTRPVTVTQERLEAAMTKQAKQKAFREALDRQIEEAERLRPHGGSDEPRPANGHRRGRSQPVNMGAGRQQTTDEMVDGRDQGTACGEPDKVMAEASVLPATGDGDTAAGLGHRPVVPETTRYSFTFEEGLGHFVEKTATPSLPHVALSPSASSGLQGTTALPKPTPPAEGGGGYGYKKRVQQAKGGAPRRLLAGAAGKGGAVMPTAGAVMNGNGSVRYQTNSLPIDLVRQGGGSGQSGGKAIVATSSPRGAGRTPGRRRSPQAGASPQETGGGGGGEPVYDTQSLPVNLIYRLEAGASAAGGMSTSHATGVLPSARGVARGAGNANALLTGRQPSPRHVSRVVLPPLHPAAPESAGRAISPDAGGRGGAPDDVIELSLIVEGDGEDDDRSGAEVRPGRHARAPGGESRPARPSSRSPPAGGVELERLQRELHSREAMVRKMREKERSWEEQVKQLKIELRNARKKERDLSRQRGAGGSSAAGLMRAPPRRAETAPDPPYPSESEGSPGGALSAVRDGRAHGPALARGGAGPPLLPLERGRGRPDFTKACIFTPNSFRPITAPDFPDTAASNPYFPSAPPPLAARGPVVHDGRRHRGADTTNDGDAKRRDCEGGGEGDGEESHDAAAHATDVPPPPPLLDSSFKLASWTTQQTTLGLPREAASCPVPIEHAHLLQFAEAQIITQQQADRLWDFFVQLKSGDACTSDLAAETDVVAYVELSDKLEVASSRSPVRTADGEDEVGTSTTPRNAGATHQSSAAPSPTPRRQQHHAPTMVLPREDYHQPRGNGGGGTGNTPVLTAALRDKINRRFQANELHAGDAPAPTAISTGDGNRPTSPGATPERMTTPPHRTPPTETLSPTPSSRHASEGRRERKVGGEVRGGHVSRSTSAQPSPSDEPSSHYTTSDDVRQPPLTTTTTAMDGVSARRAF